MQFDLFGMESSQYQPNEAVDMPSDAQRIQRLWQLVDEGFEKQILVSHNISTRHRLVCLCPNWMGTLSQPKPCVFINVFYYLLFSIREPLEDMDMGT